MVTTHSRPPLIAGDLWQLVMDRAAWRCQCYSQCGKRHDRERPSRRNRTHHRPDGIRCAREDVPGKPLHVMPSAPVGEIDAMRLPPEQLVAVCGDCHHRLARLQRRANEHATETEALFELDPHQLQPRKEL
ncbi:hypothetical protein ABN028_33980 [Actinopolymorpha sp. B17G11]|uniref:hypothetical protein n=1 Tax=Actinopolymorpha sp. B17G11 TaxID=3160861 RepID=UPI0032E50D78